MALDIESKSGADPREIIDQLDIHDHRIVWTGEVPERCERYPNCLPGVRGAQVWFAGDLPTTDKVTIPGREIRGVGGYVIAPGSVHPSGVWHEGRVARVDQLPAIPDQVRAVIVSEPAKIGGRGGKVGRTDPSVWVKMVTEGIPEPDQALLRLIRHLIRQKVHTSVVAQLAHVVNLQCCKPPLPSGDVDELFRDVCRAELAKKKAEQ